MSFAALQSERRSYNANDNFAKEPLTLEFAEANTALVKGLALSKRGINENDQGLLKEAEKEFLKALEAAESASSRSPGTTAFQWRININLGIILRRLGRPEEAIKRLEAIQDSLTGVPDPFLHTPRLFDTLGSAYAALARKHAEDPDQKNHYETASFKAYRKAIKALGRTTPTEKPERTELRVNILSNLATTYIETEQPDAALEKIKLALELLPRVKFDSPLEANLNWARILRVEAEAFRLKARTYQPDEQEKAIRAWELAVKSYDEARDHLSKEATETDWSDITIDLAFSEANLGYLLVGSDVDGGQLKAARHLCRTVQLLTGTLSYLEPLGGYIPIFQYIQGILVQISSLLVNLDDALTIFSACYDAFTKYSFPECRTIFTTSAQILLQSMRVLFHSHGLNLSNDRLEQIKALANFLASLGVSETEAPDVLLGAFQRLGWSLAFSDRIKPERLEEAPHRPEITAIGAGVEAASHPEEIVKDFNHKHILPDLPPGLSWPTETYSQARKREVSPVKNVIEFLEDPKGWLPLIQRGLVTRMILRQCDISAEQGLVNYLRDKTRHLPAHLTIPGKSDLIDREAEAYPNRWDRSVRLEQALIRRKQRSSQST